MGNSYCCFSIKNKEQLIIHSEIMIDGFEKNKIANKNNIKDNNLNINNNKIKINFIKTNETFNQEEDIDFVNPLPEIVNIKYKKNY